MTGEALGILDILNFLGLTPDRLVPLAFLTLVLYIVFHKKLHKHLSPIKNAIVEIQTIFRQNEVSVCHSLTEISGSPLKPSEYGMTLLKDSGFKNTLDKNKLKLIEELHEILIKNKPINPYDVQERARELLINKKNEEIMTKVKNYAFENALSVETILRTGALILRDEYLKKHKISKKK